MEFKLEDKKSLVLGGSSGIGLAIARRLSDRGSESSWCLVCES